MAKIQKKTAMFGVLILGSIVAAWRFVWEPIEHAQETKEAEESAVVTPVQNSPASSDAAPTTVKQSSVRTSYKTPGGEDEVGFRLTVDSEGTILTALTEVLAKNPTSIKRQEAFAEAFPQALQGKKISELTAIDKVGGSSLTTAAFNASLAQLKAGI